MQWTTPDTPDIKRACQSASATIAIVSPVQAGRENNSGAADAQCGNSISKGYTYRLSMTATVTRNGVVETISDWTESTL